VCNRGPVGLWGGGGGAVKPDRKCARFQPQPRQRIADRNEEVQPDIGATITRYRQRDQIPFGIDQRPAAVAGLDRDIGLDRLQPGPVVAAQGADDAARHRPVQLFFQRRAHGIDLLADRHRPVAYRQGREIAPIHPHQRHVARLVTAFDGADQRPPVGQHHPHPFGIADDMGVGQDQPVATDQHARPVAGAVGDQHGGRGDRPDMVLDRRPERRQSRQGDGLKPGRAIRDGRRQLDRPHLRRAAKRDAAGFERRAAIRPVAGREAHGLETGIGRQIGGCGGKRFGQRDFVAVRRRLIHLDIAARGGAIDDPAVERGIDRPIHGHRGIGFQPLDRGLQQDDQTQLAAQVHLHIGDLGRYHQFGALLVLHHIEHLVGPRDHVIAGDPHLLPEQIAELDAVQQSPAMAPGDIVIGPDAGQPQHIAGIDIAAPHPALHLAEPDRHRAGLIGPGQRGLDLDLLHRQPAPGHHRQQKQPNRYPDAHIPAISINPQYRVKGYPTIVCGATGGGVPPIGSFPIPGAVMNQDGGGGGDVQGLDRAGAGNHASSVVRGRPSSSLPRIRASGRSVGRRSIGSAPGVSAVPTTR
jgi:hypothetical protein